MPRITTFLTYPAHAEDAVALYTSIFKSSKILKTTHYNEAGPGAKGSVMTVEFELDGQRFVALNGGDHFTFTDGISLMVECKTQDEIDHYWNKLTTGGGKEIQCGWLVDKFGVSWQIAPSIMPELLSDQDPKRAQRVMEVMFQMKKLDIAALQRAYDQK